MQNVNKWTQDISGLWHWTGAIEHAGDGRHRPAIYDAASVALDTRPDNFPDVPPCVCWFWWKDSPCPMVRGDVVTTLVDRWHEWDNALTCRSCVALGVLVNFRQLTV